ncbi:MAG TPA: fibronectin type III domain-containing protein [Bryobacteraceae bacterium]|jgi:hypothetical protein
MITRLVCALLAAAGAFAQIYVSPAGDDRNSGAQGSPVRTLERARDLVRTRNQQMTGDLVVHLQAGTYRLERPLVLESRDSGSGGHNVIYRGDADFAVISGGIRVTGWKLMDRARNLWSAPAPEALKDTRQLYVDGVRAQRARGRLPVEVTPTAEGYTASTATMSTWRNPTSIEFVYTGGNSIWSERSEGLGSWTEPRCPVGAITGNTITMAQPCWDNSTKRVMLPSGERTANLVGPASVGKTPAYIENAYELLGTPGQWYFDRTARVIYYVPRLGEDLSKADVEVPVLETLIDARGVHNIEFSGLEFAYATWLRPSGPEGFSEIQANYTLTGPNAWAVQGLCTLVPNGTCPYGAWTKTPGNVSFAEAHDVQFREDAFVHLGAAALDFGNGAQGNRVEGCIFTDISANGIELGGVDQPLAKDSEITRNNRIRNNHIYDVGAEYRDGIGIVVGYAQNTLVEHNQLDHLPYASISMGWGGWPDKIRLAGQANYSRGNVVARNRIFNFMLVLADGGGIYTQGLTGPSLSEGEKVSGNLVYDQFSSGHGIYTDNGSCNITIANNVLFHLNFDNWGSRHKNYYDGADGKEYDPIDVENNWWQQGTPDGSAQNITTKGNRLIAALEQAPKALLDDAGIEPQWRHILKRQLNKTSPPEPPSRVAAWTANGYALVTWSPPVFEGGDPVKSYKVTALAGDKPAGSATISSADFWKQGYAKVPGLENGTAYVFTVSAVNVAGPSPQSLPSRTVTQTDAPVALPDKPDTARAYADSSGRASIVFRDPQGAKAKKGAPILAYSFTIRPGERKVVFGGRAVQALDGTAHTTFDVIEGLKPGETYTISVSAMTAAGEGPAMDVKVTVPL